MFNFLEKKLNIARTKKQGEMTKYTWKSTKNNIQKWKT